MRSLPGPAGPSGVGSAVWGSWKESGQGRKRESEKRWGGSGCGGGEKKGQGEKGETDRREETAGRRKKRRKEAK